MGESTQRRQPIAVDLDAFVRNGFALVKGVFDAAEIDSFREAALDIVDRSFSQARRDLEFTPPVNVTVRRDLLSCSALRGFVLDDRILSIARQVLRDTPVYYGWSKLDLRFARHWARFHKDNPDSRARDPAGQDWRGDYSAIRIALYLQDHAHHGGGIWFRAGSHRSVSIRRGRAVALANQIGDVGIWSMLTTHGVSAFPPRLLAGRKMPEVLEGLTHRIWRTARGGYSWLGTPRMVMHIVFGLDDFHLRRYLDRVRRLRTPALLYDHWLTHRYDDGVWDAVRGKDIVVKEMYEALREDGGDSASLATR